MTHDDRSSERAEHVEWAPRRAAPSDAPALTEVYLRSFRAALPTVTLAHPDHEVAEWMRDVVVGERDTWTVERDGELVALLSLDPPADDNPTFLNHLYLAPESRGLGIGNALVALAKSERPGGLQLWAFQVNAPARRFYARHGFVEVELTDGLTNEEREPDVRMVWLPAS